MDNQNLLPPSHFEPDSLDSSPQEHGNFRIISSKASSNVNPVEANSVLKTPNDFVAPQYKKTAPTSNNRKTQAFCNTSSTIKHSSHNYFGSRDSGYDWNYSKGGTASVEPIQTDEDVKMFLKKLKEENDNLKLQLKCHQVGKESSSATMEVITHQVQYIERLQQDITAASNKLTIKEDELYKQELLLHEKNLQLHQQSFQINKLTEEIEQETKEKLNISEIVADMKTQLLSSEEEKEEIKKMHNERLLIINNKHDEEVQKIHENSQKIMEEMQKQFAKERNDWGNNNAELSTKFEEKYQVMSAEHEAALDKAIKEATEEKCKLQEEKQIVENKLSELMDNEKNLNEEIADLKAKEKNYETSLKSKHDEIELQAQQIQDEKQANEKLMTYISQIQAEDHARDEWKNEKEEFSERISAIQAEKEELVKTLEILNIRFQSVSKILEMQEESISAHTKAIPDVRSQNKIAVVTSQWRMKVFELMVQCKTQQLILVEEASKRKLIEKDMKSQLEDQTRESNILSSRLEDIEAQLELKRHINATLENTNEKLKLDLKSWKSKYEEEKSSLSQLYSIVSSMRQSFLKAYEDNMASYVEKCLRLEQRLAFANNRLRTVQDLTKRKDTKWRVRLQQKSQVQNIQVGQTKKEKSNFDLEIVQLMEERDSLSHQLARDAADFEHTITKMKEKLDNSQQSNQEMEKQIIGYEEKIQELSHKIDGLETSLEDQKYEKENLKSKLLEVKNETKQAIADAVEEVKRSHLEELQEKEITLNQVKRELTKSVVALRQAERVSVRKTSHTAEQAESERKLWLTEEEKLRSEIRQLQKDNNLLSATLRQEGLLSTLKSVRGSPVKLKHNASGDGPVKKVHFRSQEEGCNKGATTKTEDVDKMLQDLTNLSEKVLADSDTE